MDAAQISSGIVEHSRQARFSGTSPELWRKRLETLIAAQSEVAGPIRVRDVKPVAEAAGGSNGTLLFRASYRAEGQPVEKAFVLRFLPTNMTSRSSSTCSVVLNRHRFRSRLRSGSTKKASILSVPDM